MPCKSSEGQSRMEPLSLEEERWRSVSIRLPFPATRVNFFELTESPSLNSDGVVVLPAFARTNASG